jgi:PAS domain S-box-containing protein
VIGASEISAAQRLPGQLLIVEDEPVDATFVQAVLADGGPLDASRVTCLADALEFIQVHDVAVVLLDLGLPDARGLQALEAVVAARPGLAVVVLTGYDDDELALRALAAGAQDYLVKGTVTADLLRRSLRHAAERAEAARTTSRLAAIVESSDDAILSTAPDGTIRTWNRAAARLFGYEAGEAVGRNLSMLVSPDGRGQVDDVLVRVMAGEHLERVDTTHRREDGMVIDVSLRLSPLVQGGNIVGVSAIARDVSSYKRVDAALRESGSRLAEAQRLTHVGSWSIDAATGRRAWSDELYRLLGHEPQAVEPSLDCLLERLHPEDESRVRLAALSQVSRPTAWEGEYRIVLPDGAVRWLATRTEPVLGDTGDVIGAHGTSQDITERKVAEEQLRFQAHLLQAVGEAIVVTDLTGTVAYWGPGAETLYGWSAQEVMGRKMLDVIPPVPGTRDRAEVRAGLARGEPWAGIMERTRRDGSTFIAQLTITPVFDDTGRLVGNISIGSDASEREHAKAALEAARDHALEASLLKSHFLANVSHEIRTPMNGVLGMTELLLGTGLDGRQREYAETVRTSGDALLAILNDILDLSKIEAGRIELESIDFDVAAVIEDVAELFAGQAQAKGLELVISVGDDVPAAVRGDPGRLRQVLSNLLGNAVKFTSTGLVMVSASAGSAAGNGTTLRLQVDDTGIGIGAEEAARIFEPFAQADSTTTRKYGGTGLGLAITRQLVELMGGRCGVDSEVGVGSSFWCTLLLPAARRSVTARPSATENGLAGANVLVVDDNPVNRVVLEGYLRGWGMEVTVAGSGGAALEAAKGAAVAGRPFGLALIDMHMPVMDGLQLARALSADPATASTSTVLLTGSGEDRDVRPSGQAGISAQLTKPVRRDRLRRCLGDVIAAGPARATTPFAEASPRSRGVILLAEDNVINQKVAVAMLESGGYRVDVVADGLAAVTAVRARQYDVVLMDCHMPEMDGFEAAAAIRAEEGEHRRAPIIALTAGAMQEDRERCLAAGMDDHLAKPVKKDDLLAAVARWVGVATTAGSSTTHRASQDLG